MGVIFIYLADLMPFWSPWLSFQANLFPFLFSFTASKSDRLSLNSGLPKERRTALKVWSKQRTKLPDYNSSQIIISNSKYDACIHRHLIQMSVISNSNISQNNFFTDVG